MVGPIYITGPYAGFYEGGGGSKWIIIIVTTNELISASAPFMTAWGLGTFGAD